ncbi:F-box only protein 5-A-like [Plodia interpunctella]|uniref:F-box only protein 5-A-like n=1 Tax=Plodia interpunctella TaxID=58824 RepID=UPI002368296E|nr:F-box only protein 5-A-like [Plodia interpunctella]
MDVSEAATPSLQTYNNLILSKSAEDSGYHTSFTPGSIDLTRISNESPSLLSPKFVITGHGHIKVAKSCDFHRDQRHNYSTLSSTINDFVDKLTPQRRGVKRSYENDLDSTNTSHSSSIVTPTSIIASKIQKLVFDDNKQHFPLSSSISLSSEQFDSNEHIPILSYPTTPVKKVCKGSCKLSPFNRRKFARKVEFATHSLSCDGKALQSAKYKKKYNEEQSKLTKYRPNQKFDIIKSLFEKSRIPVEAILKYLSNEDIYNFIRVSDTWRHIWENCLAEKNKKKQEYVKYQEAVSSNVENWENGVIPKLPDNIQARTLREIQNETRQPQSSPPGTPRTNKFQKFTRAATEDSRTQLSCVKCQYPAKVTKEMCGETWAECTNATCAYQFCKSCKGKRHTGKSCLQYDLNEPSPSKRKKNFYPISSKKSKKNLCRLLC